MCPYFGLFECWGFEDEWEVLHARVVHDIGECVQAYLAAVYANLLLSMASRIIAIVDSPSDVLVPIFMRTEGSFRVVDVPGFEVL